MTTRKPASIIKDSPILPIICYCLSANSMVFANKIIMSSYGFNHGFFVVAIQAIITLIIFTSCSKLGLITHRRLNKKDALRWLPVSVSLVAMMYTGSKTLQFMSIALYNIFKNIVIIIIAFGERWWFKGVPVTPLIMASFILMIGSSALVGWEDIKTTPPKDQNNLIAGYFWVTANCITTAMFSLVMKSRISGIGFKDYDTVYFNQTLCLPILLLCSVIFEQGALGDLGARYSTDLDGWKRLMFAFFVSGFTQFAISYSFAWCLRVTSSTTMGMIGPLNKMPLSVISMFYFQELISLTRIEGIILALGAGLLYAHAKNLQAHAIAKAKAKGEMADEEEVLPLRRPQVYDDGVDEVDEKERLRKKFEE